MGFRIINAGKSKYYGAALSNFKQAKKCYEEADLETVWMETIEKVMNNQKTVPENREDYPGLLS